MPSRDDPQCPDDWIEIYHRYFKDIRASYKGGASKETRVACALDMVEAALKALVWQQKGWNQWPEKSKGYNYLYYHDFTRMAREAGIIDEILGDPSLRVSWDTIVNIGKRQTKYKLDAVGDKEAHDIVRSARDAHTGIGPWLLKKYNGII